MKGAHTLKDIAYQSSEVKRLWDLLDIPDDERKAAMDHFTGCPEAGLAHMMETKHQLLQRQVGVFR